MRCFYQSNPTRKVYRKQMTAFRRELGIFERRLVDQARVVRTSEWLTEMELEGIKRKILTPRIGEENQEMNDIPVEGESIQNENGLMKPMKQRYEYM